MPECTYVQMHAHETHGLSPSSLSISFIYTHIYIYILPGLCFICIPRHMFIYTSACEKIVVFKPNLKFGLFFFIVHALKPRKILTNCLTFGFWDCFICGFADELIRRQENYIGLCGKCVFASIIDRGVRITTDCFRSPFSLLSWSLLVVPNEKATLV